MDPFSALSIATAVVQFVEFGTKVGQRMLVMYDANRLDPLESFEGITKDLDNYVEEMRDHLHPLRHRNGSVAADANAEAIEKLLASCQALAQDLLVKFKTILGNIPANKSKSRNLLRVPQVAASAASAVWNQRDIESTIGLLESYRSQIVLRMLLMLDIRATASAALGEDIQQNLSNITEVLAVVQERHRLEITDQANRLMARMDKSDAISSRAYEHVVAAVLTLANGETKLLSPTTQTFPQIEGFIQPGETGPRKLVQFKAAAMSSNTDSKVRDMGLMERRILHSLYFRGMHDRQEVVKTRHAETYEWIFCNPDEEQKPWDDFADWVVNGSGCYWICGKAGSGKSTLMKFINQDPRLATLTQKWAEGHELKTSSFFFWALGSSSLQKSQEGLLRGILYELLSKNEELIPHVMPDILPVVSHLKEDKTLEPPSLAELMRWFRRLLELEGRDFRFLFLLDGIDEYEGDPGTIVEFISSLSQNPHVKFLFSSRPIPACVENFARFPKLQLHELTSEDIGRYTRDTLRQRQPQYQLNDEDLDTLTDVIVQKSYGVFIWVQLTVMSIIRGVENRDNMEELKQRLEELPSDLKELYAHMMKSMSPLYKQQAARMFRALFAARTQVERGVPLSTLQFSFLDAEDVETENWERQHLLASEAILFGLRGEEEQERCEQVSGRIRSRCCGLVETRRATSGESRVLKSLRYEYPCVDFFHKTVVEFLTDSEVWESITVNSGPDFIPEHNLFYASALVALTQPTPQPTDKKFSQVWNMGTIALDYAKKAESRFESPIPAVYLQGLDRILVTHSKAQVDPEEWDDNYHWAVELPRVALVKLSMHLRKILRMYPGSQDFGSVCISWSLHSFIQHELSLGVSSRILGDLNSRSRHLYGSVLAYNNICEMGREDVFGESKALEISRLLLEHGANPNAHFAAPDEKEESSAWHYLLRHLASHTGSHQTSHKPSNGRRGRQAKLVLAFLAAGANVNEVVEVKADDGRLSWSAMAVLDHIFRPPGSRSLLDGPGQSNAFASLLQLHEEAPNTSSPPKAFHEALMKQLADAGAQAREWKDGVLTRGPPETSKKTNRVHTSSASSEHKSTFRRTLKGLFKR